jgi:hypothetical protein
MSNLSFYHDPSAVVYHLQAFIYAITAWLSWGPQHRALTVCYAICSALHLLLGACHLLHT